MRCSRRGSSSRCPSAATANPASSWPRRRCSRPTRGQATETSTRSSPTSAAAAPTARSAAPCIARRRYWARHEGGAVKLTRRKAIIGGIVGGGLLSVGFRFVRGRDRVGSRTLFNGKADEGGLNGWVKIARDDSVTVAVPRAEMGQGIHTALAMLVAEEMDARWDQVRVEDPPEDGVYRNVEMLIDSLPFSPEETGMDVDLERWGIGKLGGALGILGTGGSTGARDARLPLRTAGAHAAAPPPSAAAA